MRRWVKGGGDQSLVVETKNRAQRVKGGSGKEKKKNAKARVRCTPEGCRPGSRGAGPGGDKRIPRVHQTGGNTGRVALPGPRREGRGGGEGREIPSRITGR